MTQRQGPPTTDHKPGDVVDGQVMIAGGVWVPIAAEPSAPSKPSIPWEQARWGKKDKDTKVRNRLIAAAVAGLLMVGGAAGLVKYNEQQEQEQRVDDLIDALSGL